MSKFVYKAKVGPDKVVTGTIEANNLENAVSKIIKLGYAPVDVIPDHDLSKTISNKLSPRLLPFRRRVPAAERVAFIRNLYDMVDAGVPIIRTLRLAQAQARHPRFRDVVAGMASAVENGDPLSKAMLGRPDSFPAFYGHMVRAGEMSGKLDAVLGRLAELSERELETSTRLKTSMIYPLFLLSAGVLAAFVLLTFVIPQLTVAFEDLDQELPMITQALIALSGFLVQFWWLLLFAAAAIVWYWKTLRAGSAGRAGTDQLLLRLPVWGEFLKSHELERFSRTLGTLLGSGVEIVSALRTVADLAENEVIKQEIQKVAQDVAQGSSLTGSLGASPLFPAPLVNMVAVGEETGDVARGLTKLAESYNQQLERSIKTALSMVEPIIILLVGGLLGMFVIAILLPIFQMNMIIQ